MEFKLGRLYAPDTRDKKHLMRSVLPRTSEVTVRYWDDTTWWGDQGSTSQCVGYSWVHWLEDGPVVHDHSDTPPPVVDPSVLYAEAQKIDEWPGEDYEGTSVRAGAKVLQSLGYVVEYRWAWDAETVARTVLDIGPVVVGTNWYYDMFYPDANGVIKPTGANAGGHAYLINGYDSTTRMFRIKNSWGRSWGVDGYAFISFDDLNKLILEYGEACLASEVALAVIEPEDGVVEPVEPAPVEPGPVDPAPIEPDPEPSPDIVSDIKRWIGKVINWFRKLFGV